MRDPHLDDRHREIELRVRDFGERHLRAVARDEEDPAGRAREIARLLGDAGLLSATVPPPLGAMDARSLALLREGLAYFSLLAESVFATQGTAALLLAKAGTEIQKERWLPGLLAGTTLATLALAEPETGFDLGSVRAAAERVGARWRLTGVKTWVVLAGLTGPVFVLARSAPGEGDHGLSLFLLDGEAPGLTVRPIEPMVALPVGELTLDGALAVQVGEDGRGLRLLARTHEVFRPAAAMAACGLAARAFDETVRHVMTERRSSAPLAASPVVKATLGEMAAELQAARGLALRSAWLADMMVPEAPFVAAAARVCALETATRVTQGAARLHGAQGLVRGSTMERLYREARVLAARDGPVEQATADLAEAVLKEKR